MAFRSHTSHKVTGKKLCGRRVTARGLVVSPYYLASCWHRLVSSKSAARLAIVATTATAATAILLTPLYVERAVAQIGVGILSGRVVDASTGKPMADVVVTATSPGLQIEQIVVTDSSGTFRIPN